MNNSYKGFIHQLKHYIPLVCLNIFFIFHLFTGELSIQNMKNDEFSQLLKQQQILTEKQKRLNEQISFLEGKMNQDYLETLALNMFNKVPSNCKIHIYS